MRIERERLACGRVHEDKASLVRVRGEGNFGFFAGIVQMEDQVVREGGGEDEGRAFDGKDDRGLEEAGDGIGIGRAQGWWHGGLNGRQPDHDDRFGIVERGWGVEPEVECFVAGKGDGGNVLVFGGVEAAHDADEINDRAHVGAVEPSAADGGVGGLVDEIGAGTVAKGVGDGLAVAVVKQHLVAGLGEAGGLCVDGLLEAVEVGLEIESAGEEFGVLGERLWVVGRHTAHVCEIGLYSRLLEASLCEILRGANEDAGPSADSGAEGAEVAAGFGRKKEDNLLGFLRNDDRDAFVADLLVPGLNFSEPAVGRRVGGTAEEGRDEKVMDRLGGGKVGVQPNFVAGLKIGNLGNGKSATCAGNVDVDFRAG